MVAQTPLLVCIILINAFHYNFFFSNTELVVIVAVVVAVALFIVAVVVGKRTIYCFHETVFSPLATEFQNDNPF